MNAQFEIYDALPTILGFPPEMDGRYVRRMMADPARAQEFTDYHPYRLWRPGAGIQVWIGAHDDETCNYEVHYEGRTRAQVRLLQMRPVRGHVSRGRCLGHANPAADEGGRQILFDVPDFGRFQHCTLPVVASVQLTAFAFDLLVEDSHAHAGPSAPGALRKTQLSFLPYGLITPNRVQQPTCFAMVTGWVTENRTLTNPVTGQPFEWAAIETECGPIDLVTDPDLVRWGKLEPGSFVHALAVWMSGRLPESLATV